MLEGSVQVCSKPPQVQVPHPETIGFAYAADHAHHCARVGAVD